MTTEPSSQLTDNSRGRSASKLTRAWDAVSSIPRNPAGIASLVALLVGIIMILLHLHGSSETEIHSIGYAIIGAAGFSLMYQFFADRALLEAIGSRISEVQGPALQKMMAISANAISDNDSSFRNYAQQMAAMHRRHWPLEVYPEGNEPNGLFNDQLE